MGIVVPKKRKHMHRDALLRKVQNVFGQIPDHQKGSPNEALMSVFAMSSLKAALLLALDKERSKDHLQRVGGVGRVPCDASIREILDPVQSECLQPAWKVRSC